MTWDELLNTPISELDLTIRANDPIDVLELIDTKPHEIPSDYTEYYFPADKYSLLGLNESHCVKTGENRWWN